VDRFPRKRQLTHAFLAVRFGLRKYQRAQSGFGEIKRIAHGEPLIAFKAALALQ
jgi:hypothetical protein